MERYIRILPSGARRVEWATKVDAIPGDERPIAIDDDGFQFPVLPPALANPGDMRRFCMTSPLSECRSNPRSASYLRSSSLGKPCNSNLRLAEGRQILMGGAQVPDGQLVRGKTHAAQN